MLISVYFNLRVLAGLRLLWTLFC